MKTLVRCYTICRQDSSTNAVFIKINQEGQPAMKTKFTTVKKVLSFIALIAVLLGLTVFGFHFSCRMKAEGKHLGRPEGSKTRKKALALYHHEAFILQELEQGTPIREIARKLHCSRNTVRNYIQAYIMEE